MFTRARSSKEPNVKRVPFWETPILINALTKSYDFEVEIIVKDVITCKTNTSFSSDKEGRRLFERLFGGSDTLLRSNFIPQKQNTLTSIILFIFILSNYTNVFITIFSYSCFKVTVYLQVDNYLQSWILGSKSVSFVSSKAHCQAEL